MSFACFAYRDQAHYPVQASTSVSGPEENVGTVGANRNGIKIANRTIANGNVEQWRGILRANQHSQQNLGIPIRIVKK